MDALTLLKADHAAVEAKFKKFEGLGERALKSKAAIVATCHRGAVGPHVHREAAAVPGDPRADRSDDEDMVLEALEEHHVVKWTLSTSWTA